MDDERTKRAWYRIVVERDFLKKKGNAFQDFFADIMEKRYPSDFIRVRPWGNVGDRKNDGYLPSQRTLFQVFAPNEMSAAEAVSKIDEDFNGALPHWNEYFDSWVFVHNSPSGLGPDVTAKLLELKKQHSPLAIKTFGFEELSRIALSLPEDDLIALCGGIIALTTAEIRDVSFEDLKLILMNIARQPQVSDADLRPVPAEKLEKSGLSDEASHLLTRGMLKSARVRKFLADWPDPLFGNHVVASFRYEYRALRRAQMVPNAIFHELLVFAGGLGSEAIGHRGAVLAVLAYLFEECEIFERPEESPEENPV